MGYLNWDCLTGMPDCFEELYETLNLVQLINGSTRPNPKAQNKFTLLYLILTNTSHTQVHLNWHICQ